MHKSIPGFNIRDRHHTILPAIGTFEQENEAYNLVSILMVVLPFTVSFLALLDFGLFYLYNTKFHPWSTILADEKPRKDIYVYIYSYILMIGEYFVNKKQKQYER